MPTKIDAPVVAETLLEVKFLTLLKKVQAKDRRSVLAMLQRILDARA